MRELIWHCCQAVPPWFPRIDDVFLEEPVRDAVLAGRIARVPFIAGQLSSMQVYYVYPA